MKRTTRVARSVCDLSRFSLWLRYDDFIRRLRQGRDSRGTHRARGGVPGSAQACLQVADRLRARDWRQDVVGAVDDVLPDGGPGGTARAGRREFPATTDWTVHVGGADARRARTRGRRRADCARACRTDRRAALLTARSGTRALTCPMRV